MKHFGFTYSTEPHNFGEVTSAFEVESNWEGFRHHGYGQAPASLEEAFDKGEITWEEFVASL